MAEAETSARALVRCFKGRARYLPTLPPSPANVKLRREQGPVHLPAAFVAWAREKRPDQCARNTSLRNVAFFCQARPVLSPSFAVWPREGQVAGLGVSTQASVPGAQAHPSEQVV